MALPGRNRQATREAGEQKRPTAEQLERVDRGERYESLRHEVQVCTRCIYDSDVPGITFDDQGVCNYCHMVDELSAQYHTGEPAGEAEWMRIVDRIKHAGRMKRYDCVIGVSGGTDSSFLMHMAVEVGLRPLAVHYDNTWNSTIATENIKKVTEKLGINLYTYVVNNKEADDIFRSFILAGVPELEASTDLALAEVLYRAADKFGVKCILEGHSFITEGVAPLGNVYFDGRYLTSIHNMFGTMEMKTFPNMPFFTFLKWVIVKRIRKYRPLWYIGYSKEAARALLEKEYDWVYYGGHHLENRMTAFYHSYYLPNRFGIDLRNLSLAAAARTGQKPRTQCIDEYGQPPYLEEDLLDYALKRLGYTESEFMEIMRQPNHTYRDYPTYKKWFEALRPLFFILAKANLVPMSFYLKYTSKTET